MELLNIDELMPPERYLRFKGVNYEVKSFTLADFLRGKQEGDRLQEVAMTGDTKSMIEEMIKVVQKSVPSMPIDVLESMTLNELTIVTQFVRGVTVEELEAQIKADVSEDQEQGAQAGN
ncbi:hypothetical protein [Chitinibacter tainanensis]|uniref:hypothetical protein n=1 Tax=Chitinibacter tainanensis TaxID=230667 RepID=UPI0004283B95|nr:hypothetical protein [Chitinibacter tainanensis]